MFWIDFAKKKYASSIVKIPPAVGIIFVNPELTFKKYPLAITPKVTASIKKIYDARGYFIKIYAAHSRGSLCFKATPDKKFHINFAVVKAAFSAFTCSSGESSSKSFSHSAL